MSSEIKIDVNRNGEVYTFVNKDNSVLLISSAGSQGPILY